MAIDKNLVERQVKPRKLGATNWPFVGSELAGRHAAAGDESGAVGRAQWLWLVGLLARRVGSHPLAPQPPVRQTAAASLAVELTNMEKITQAVMVQADIDVQRMSTADKVELADEIFVEQPNLLASILALPRMGVSMVKLEVPLHILFVTFQAMKRSGHVWPIVSEDVQDRCLQRLTARARFNEGIPAHRVDQMVQTFCDAHRERYLLAFVYGHLGDHDLLRVRTDAEKYLLLAALNLAECLADVGTITSA